MQYIGLEKKGREGTDLESEQKESPVSVTGSSVPGKQVVSAEAHVDQNFVHACAVKVVNCSQLIIFVPSVRGADLTVLYVLDGNSLSVLIFL